MATTVLNNDDGDASNGCANMFDLIATPSNSHNHHHHYFSTSDLTLPIMTNVSTSGAQSLLPFEMELPSYRTPVDSSQQTSPVRREEDKTSPPVPSKRKHSDVERERRRSISNGFAILQNVLHNDSNAKPVSKSILLHQACDEIRELRKKLDASTTIISRFGLENLFSLSSSTLSSSHPTMASRIHSPSPMGVGAETPRDSRRAATSTSVSGTQHGVSLTDYHREEGRRASSKRAASNCSSSEASESGSFRRGSISSGNTSDIEEVDSASETESDVSDRTRTKDRLKRSKKKQRLKDRDRRKSRPNLNVSSYRFPPTPSSKPSGVPSSSSSSGPHSITSGDLKQAILSLLLELPSQLEDVNKQIRSSYPQLHTPPDETEDQTLAKSRPKKRYR